MIASHSRRARQTSWRQLDDGRHEDRHKLVVADTAASFASDTVGRGW